MRTALLALLVVCQAATYEKFFLMMFENHGYSQVQGNSYWTKIMANSFQPTNYYGVTHPSQPNYVAQLGGNYFTCTDDSTCNLNKPNLVDLMDTKGGLTWRAYEENYVPLADGNCNPYSSGNTYYRKHNPFMSFTDISQNATRCQNIRNETAFQQDVKNGSLPNFGYYTPNINDDSHDQDLDYSGQYLQNFINTWVTPFPSTWKNVLFMVTFDEDDHLEGNHVVSFFMGPLVTIGGQGTATYTHYSITRFIEDNWNLGSLNQHDTTANNFANELH